MFQQLSTATVQCVGSTSLCCDLDININAMCFDLLNRVLGMNAFDVFHPLTPVPKILTQAANVKKSAKNYYINCRHFLKFLYTIITIPNHLSFSFLFFFIMQYYLLDTTVLIVLRQKTYLRPITEPTKWNSQKIPFSAVLSIMTTG